MSQVVDCKLKYQTEKGKRLKAPCRLEYKDGRIIFRKSPFGMKDEIKAMAGAKWHGFDKVPKKYWSVADNFRNQFQLHYMMGENVYEWFERPLQEIQYRDYYRNGVLAPPMVHQVDMANHGLSYHFQIWGAEMGTGKTLSAQMVIENSNVNHWYWVGPKTSLPNIQREFKIWGFDETIATIEYMTYERLVRIMDDWHKDDPLPGGVIFDESSRCKTCTSQRSMAAQKLADLMRSKYMWDAYVILMSGTPSPKRPTDWWSQCEIAWPGFLREGSVKALEKRLAFQVQKTFDSGTFWTTVGWRDDEHKCRECGLTHDEGDHERDVTDLEAEIHKFVASKNEVSYMFKRLDGLALIKHKKDCLTLPEKRYRKVECKPTSSLLRVAKTVVDIVDGTKPCDHCPDACGEVDEWFDPEDEFKCFEAIDMLDEELVSRLEKRTVTCPKCNGSGEIKKTKRITKTVPCPKEKALKGLLGECEETGRVVVFAGFTGSVDRCVDICHREGWAVVRCDGRGFQVTDADGTSLTDVDPLEFWADMENKSVAFVAHPESGGMSLTLVEARMVLEQLIQT
jgi:SNF2 family DNA or RNA helicase